MLPRICAVASFPATHCMLIQAAPCSGRSLKCLVGPRKIRSELVVPGFEPRTNAYAVGRAESSKPIADEEQNLALKEEIRRLKESGVWPST